MIFSEELQNNCKNLCTYFEKIFKQGAQRLAPSIILYGIDAELNYNFALELARILNCTKDKSHNCNCINCQWIKKNDHPNVKTYSNLEEKTKSSESKLIITVAQITELKNELLISNENNRVYIFCGAKSENGKIKHTALDSKILGQEASNALLKTIEEPPKNTYFIFLTKDKNDLLPTIISRSQKFYIPSQEKKLTQIEGLDDIFKNYPCTNYQMANSFIKSIQNWQENNQLEFETTVDYIQNYLKDFIKTNINNVHITNTITKDIIKFEDAKKQYKNDFKEYVIWENLTYKIYKD